jgi:hypothetical protein
MMSGSDFVELQARSIRRFLPPSEAELKALIKREFSPRWYKIEYGIKKPISYARCALNWYKLYK